MADHLHHHDDPPAPDEVMLLRITAPHFCAGAVFQRAPASAYWVCVRAAPIIPWLQRTPIKCITKILIHRGYRWEWVGE